MNRRANGSAGWFSAISSAAAVCGPSGARGLIEYRGQPLRDAMNFVRQPLRGAAAEVFAGDADDPAAVDHVVGREKYAALVEPHRVRGGFQLIVGGAGDDPALQTGDGPGIQHRAEGARRKDLDILKQNGFGWHGLAPNCRTASWTLPAFRSDTTRRAPRSARSLHR